MLAAVLTLSVGAAVLVNWDDIFSDRFGPEGAETPMAEKAFQPVNVSSVCDDVTLTIREALVDEKSIYLILDYQLPDTVDRETVEMAYNSHDGKSYRRTARHLHLSHRRCLLGGLEGCGSGPVGALDWTEQPLRRKWLQSPPWADTPNSGGSSGQAGEPGL